MLDLLTKKPTTGAIMATPTPVAIAIAPSPTPPRHALAPAVNRAVASSAPSVLTAMASLPPSAAPVTLDDRLPTFTARREVTLDKVDNRNALVFSVPTGSSLLLKLVAPRAHTYEERDLRWLHLLQGIAIVPSRKADTIAQLATQALQLIRSPVYKQKLHHALHGLLDVLTKSNGSALSFSQKALLALRMKDKVAEFLREWVTDPVEGFVLRQDHVVGGMRLDDVVATPVGAGYLRGYRPHDQFCVVVFPWGHGFVHRSKVEKLDQAIEHERKKRHHNEYLALEHQHLYEQVESLLENHPPVLSENADPEGDVVTNVEGVDVEQYTKLLAELQEEHYDPEVLEHDLNFVRRVQTLVSRLSKRQRTQSNAEAEEEDEEEKDAKDESLEDPSDVTMTEAAAQGNQNGGEAEEDEVADERVAGASAAEDAEDDDALEDDDEPMK